MAATGRDKIKFSITTAPESLPCQPRLDLKAPPAIPQNSQILTVTETLISQKEMIAPQIIYTSMTEQEISYEVKLLAEDMIQHETLLWKTSIRMALRIF